MRQSFFYLILLGFTFQLSAQEVPQGNLLAHWQGDDIPGSWAYDNAYNEVWGLAVNDHEYAIVGSTLGTHFIDVTDTDNVFEAFFVEGKTASQAIIHRDYHDNDGFLYAVCDEGQSSLQVIDIRSLPDSITVVYDSPEYINTTHNIFIDEEKDRLYSCAHDGDLTGYSALRIFDIQDPMNPIDLGGTSIFETFQVGHVHDAYVKDNIAYLNCGPQGFALVDMSNLDSLVLLGFLNPDDYPDSGYNHSGWLTEEEDIYYMADENHGLDIKVINVTDYSDLETVSTFNAGFNAVTAIAHNIIVKGNMLYVSYYYDGLQVYDISDRENPVRIMHYPTSTLPNTGSYEGAWGVYPLLPSGNILVTDMQEGLFVVEGVNNISTTDDLSLSTFSIYPNPVSDQFQIQLKKEGEYDYAIKNISGQILSKGKINSNIISLNTIDMQAGTYLIELNSGLEVFSQKFVVTK